MPGFLALPRAFLIPPASLFLDVCAVYASCKAESTFTLSDMTGDSRPFCLNRGSSPEMRHELSACRQSIAVSMQAAYDGSRQIAELASRAPAANVRSAGIQEMSAFTVYRRPGDQAVIIHSRHKASAVALRRDYFCSGASNTRQVVVACAYSLPSGPTMRPSAVANWRPQWTTVPMARSGPVLCEAARTMLRLSSAVV